MYDIPEPGVDGGNSLSQNMADVTRFTIISLDIIVNGMAARADLARSLTVQMKCSISGTCSFLGAHFRFIHKEAIFLRSGSRSLSACIFVILRLRCRYNLCTC